MDLNNKTVLITGAAQRIGRAIACSFADKGCRILIHYRSSKDEADTLVQELTAKGAVSQSYQADLCSVDSLDQMIAAILKEQEGVDILINNASRFYPTPLKTTSEAQWDEFIAIHVKAPFFLSQQLAPVMKQRGAGRIVNIADCAALNPRKNYVAYSASKAALVAVTQGLAKELAPEILVNAVLPGPILPPLGMDETEQRHIAARTLLKRWGRPEDVARQVVFLVEQDYATGHHYFVDGGMSWH